MKILYIHQYFTIPSESAATRSYWISRKIIERGHKVILITSTDGSIHKSGVENIDGIEVHYVLNPYNNYMPIYRKLVAFVKFIFQATREALKIKDIDIVYATSTPLTVGFIALILKRIKKWSFIFEVRDLWPEFPIQIGALKNKLVIKVLRFLEKRIYINSEHIVALSPGMKDGIVQAGIHTDKVSMIPNMSKPNEFYPHEVNLEIIKRFQINLNSFKVIHFGSMGKANGLEYIVNAAKCCNDKHCYDIDFIFVGSGATEQLLKTKVKEYQLDNVKFLGHQNMYSVAELVNCCDISIVSFLNLPILSTNSPNKLFDSLSAGKPVIVNSNGWTKDLVEKDNCGFYVNPDDPNDLAQKLIEIKDRKELLELWGKNARDLSLNKYNRDILSSRVVDIIENTISNQNV